MRKQTKLVAVLSTAALLALGASMSSFAATGWQEENGTWVYYDKSGDKETEKWEKSGDNWFYLNEDGEMSTDVIVEYDDNYYYVDDNGSMVTNKWVSVTNEDYDGDNADEPANYWYYFGSNGKAYKTSATSTSATFKTINGKKYIFDDEGKMLYGWINKEGERETTEEDRWQNGDYYCGDENDGAQSVGWVSIDIVDNDYESSLKGGSSKNVFDDENQTRWFYFKSNGKKLSGENGKTINGKKYSFDKYGRMNAEWVNWDATPSLASQSDDNTAAAIASNSHGFRYYGSPEDGARVTKGWFQVVPDSYLNDGDYDDDSTNWYYSDKDGRLTANELKTINGKKYLFDQYGAMQDGLRAVIFESGSTSKVADIKKSDKIDGNHFDTEDEFKAHMSDIYTDLNYRLYYFGSGDDGAMKTGKQTVSIDGTNFSFLFNKSGSTKGQGKFGIDSDKYYLGGMLMQADKDDKYSVVKIVKDGDTFTEIKLLTTEQFLFGEDGVGAVSDVPTTKADDYDEYYDLTEKADDKTEGTVTTQYRLVNTSGTVQKSKSKAKDGDSRCYEVGPNKVIKSVFVES
jgi:glucan-binding YG repeat protein